MTGGGLELSREAALRQPRVADHLPDRRSDGGMRVEPGLRCGDDSVAMLARRVEHDERGQPVDMPLQREEL